MHGEFLRGGSVPTNFVASEEPSSDDEGISRSLRCCKRRSVVSDLSSFGRRWTGSRQRIAILHPDIGLSSHACQLAKALCLQGHAVTVYCATSASELDTCSSSFAADQGYAQPTQAAQLDELRTMQVRLREAVVWLWVRKITEFFFNKPTPVFAICLVVRVLTGTMMLYLCKQFFSFSKTLTEALFPPPLQTEKPKRTFRESISRFDPTAVELRPYIYDICFFFGERNIPHLFLRKFCRRTVFVPENSYDIQMDDLNVEFFPPELKKPPKRNRSGSSLAQNLSQPLIESSNMLEIILDPFFDFLAISVSRIAQGIFPLFYQLKLNILTALKEVASYILQPFYDIKLNIISFVSKFKIGFLKIILGGHDPRCRDALASDDFMASALRKNFRVKLIYPPVQFENVSCESHGIFYGPMMFVSVVRIRLNENLSVIESSRAAAIREVSLAIKSFQESFKDLDDSPNLAIFFGGEIVRDPIGEKIPCDFTRASNKLRIEVDSTIRDLSKLLRLSDPRVTISRDSFNRRRDLINSKRIVALLFLPQDIPDIKIPRDFMASEIPIIAGTGGAAFVRHGGNGLLVKPNPFETSEIDMVKSVSDSIKAMWEIYNRCSDDSEEDSVDSEITGNFSGSSAWKFMGSLARQKILADFSEETFATKLDSYVTDLLAGQPVDGRMLVKQKKQNY